ncbi:MAG TPA: glycerol-3-phosphate acyltransferase [Dehalococcoidales bacterium]
MIVNDFVTGLVALLIGYVLGSFPTAYLLTKWKTGKDIRKLGGGNVGGLNTFKEVGIWAAIAVTIIDIGKGAATVAITHYVLNMDKPFVLIAAVGVVLGHNWMPWLKFSGGKGMGATVGVLVMIMPLYGYLLELAIFGGIVALPLLLTRNVALSMGLGLVALPFLGWLSIHSGLFVVWSLVVGIIIAIKFASTGITVIAKSTSLMDFIKGH